MSVSPTYADLGGGLESDARPRAAAALPARANALPPTLERSHVCRPEESGYCGGCGRRDDGVLAPGSPAWLAERGAK